MELVTQQFNVILVVKHVKILLIQNHKIIYIAQVVI